MLYSLCVHMVNKEKGFTQFHYMLLHLFTKPLHMCLASCFKLLLISQLVLAPVSIGGSPSQALNCLSLCFSTRLFAIGSQLSPEVGSSGIEMLETDVFKLHCFQTLTGQWCQKKAEIMIFSPAGQLKIHPLSDIRIKRLINMPHLLIVYLNWRVSHDLFHLCSFRDKVHRAGGPSTIWYRCAIEEDLWDLFRFRPQEPVLFSGNANQVIERTRMMLPSTLLSFYVF